MSVIRLDKFLADMGKGTRSEVRSIIKSGRVTINGIKTDAFNIKINTEKDIAALDGNIIAYEKYVYIMMNKPAGVISATEDKNNKTVVDLLSDNYKSFKPFPVGRLDKDTAGLVILTNDGAFAHNSLSPAKHVPKRYTAYVTGELEKSAISFFAEGIKLKDFTCRSAELIIKEKKENYTETEVVISEGKFHQVKRMFEAVGCHVIYLKRTAFGNIILDDSLRDGEYRPLNDREMEYIGVISKKGD